MAGGYTREVALAAVGRLLSSVLVLVLFQNHSSSSGIVALIALERLFSRIDPDVFF